MALQTSPESPVPVRAVATGIAHRIDDLTPLWVEGQVTQISRRQGSATAFLVLRDPLADVSMTVTARRDVLDSLDPPLVEGASVVVHAKPQYYVPKGTVSLEARQFRMVGLGELLARMEREKRLLAAEGLFAPERKRRLPFLPRCIGLVTSPGSAAEQDVLEVARRRWPQVRFRVAAATMQGTRAAEENIAAIRSLDADPEVDVIIVARGGGSVEDLMPFSNAGLIRVVFAVTTPVVSAIGHDQDTPLLDLVADLRAATPTDAAKLVVPDMAEESHRLTVAVDRLRASIRHRTDREQALLDALRSRPAMADPRTLLDRHAEEIDQLADRGRRTVGHRLDRATDEIGHQLARARALSPLATLRRGYAVLTDPAGRLVSSVADVGVGAEILVRVADGRLHATTTHAEPLALPEES
ncbi:exodeoxyribonuclease VII large subunit [Nocardioides limicola]|uniref:exodeoxyribonuclease VII large subunit n=1 Tax=Nocardioides limicola TaxID=2803368 RepID=UPI00193B48D2|nr:exodeoxyribonuclease VII large subunit [Nocardioides sp. DJM-14]